MSKELYETSESKNLSKNLTKNSTENPTGNRSDNSTENSTEHLMGSPNKSQSKYETGMNLLKKLHGPNSGDKILAAMSDVAPDFVRMVAEFAMADFLERPHLDVKTREFLIIALCVSLGALPQAKAHMESAFESGATKEELSEVILQVIPICGFPLATNGLITLKEVLETRKKK